jgi:hypothetical protein
MKRMQVVLVAALACLCVTRTVSAQLGMNVFSKPNIVDIFKPVVGNGGLYQTQRTGKDKPTQMEMTIVGQEMVDGQQGWWMEMGYEAPRGGANGQPMYSKVLMTSDFQVKKVVFQVPGQPAMEMPYNLNDSMKNRVKDENQKWHQVGSESITVPAGTYSCVHWKKDDGSGDVWASDKISPIGIVKMVEPNQTMVLVKAITGATGHITGPVSKFDPQLFQQILQQQARQPQ